MEMLTLGQVRQVEEVSGKNIQEFIRGDCGEEFFCLDNFETSNPKKLHKRSVADDGKFLMKRQYADVPRIRQLIKENFGDVSGDNSEEFIDKDLIIMGYDGLNIEKKFIEDV